MNDKKLLWIFSFVLVLSMVTGFIGLSAQSAFTHMDASLFAESTEYNRPHMNSGASIQGSSSLLPDGSFEERPSLWSEADNVNGQCGSRIGPWEQETTIPAYHGEQYFWGGGLCEVDEQTFWPINNSASMMIQVPEETPAISFRYWAQRTSPDTFEDFAYVEAEIIDVGTDELWSYALEGRNNTNGWQEETLDLSDYAGQEILLRFRVAHGTTQFAGHMFFDFVEFGEPAAETWKVNPRSDNSFSYTTASGRKITDVFVPAGAVDGDTIMVYKPVISPESPLNLSGESPFGGSLIPQGPFFDLDAYNHFLYLPMIVNNTTGTSRGGYGQSLTGLSLAGANEPAVFHFNRPVKLTIYYDGDDVVVPEEQLFLYYWDGNEWKDAASTCPVEDWVDNADEFGYHRDLINDWFELNVCHFTRFGTVGAN